MGENPAGLTLAIALVLIASISTTGGLATTAGAGASPDASAQSGVHSTLSSFDPTLTATRTVSPLNVQTGGPISLQTTTNNGGTPPYGYTYTGLPGRCFTSNTQSFSCNPSQTGNHQIQVIVTDSHGNYSLSNSESLTVTSSSGGGSGNNSTNPFSGLLSGFSGILSLLIILGIVGFVTWILLIVGVWIIAIVLLRRLPKRGATLSAPVPMVKCTACSASIPAGSKFCSECGASTVPKTA